MLRYKIFGRTTTSGPFLVLKRVELILLQLSSFGLHFVLEVLYLFKFKRALSSVG